MKTNVIPVILLLLVISSCNNRKDPYLDMDSGPILQVAKISDNVFYS